MNQMNSVQRGSGRLDVFCSPSKTQNRILDDSPAVFKSQTIYTSEVRPPINPFNPMQNEAKFDCDRIQFYTADRKSVFLSPSDMSSSNEDEASYPIVSGSHMVKAKAPPMRKLDFESCQTKNSHGNKNSASSNSSFKSPFGGNSEQTKCSSATKTNSIFGTPNDLTPFDLEMEDSDHNQVGLREQNSNKALFQDDPEIDNCFLKLAQINKANPNNSDRYIPHRSN